MSLFDRLVGPDKDMPVHQFQAACYEWEDGAVTRADVIAAFNISAGDEADLDWLKARWADARTNGKLDSFRKVFDNSLLLAEEQIFYDTEVKLRNRLTDASGP